MLVFAAKVWPAGCTFLRRMLATLAMTKDRKRSVASPLVPLNPAKRRPALPPHRIPLKASFRSDVAWWREFITPWNCVALLPDTHWCASGTLLSGAPAMELFTDACNTCFGAVWERKWLHGNWSTDQLQAAKRKDKLSMHYLELLVVAIALATWVPILTGRKITIRSDSQTAVEAVNGGACRDKEIMQLVRTLLLTAARHQFALRCVHSHAPHLTPLAVFTGTSTNTACLSASKAKTPQTRSVSPSHTGRASSVSTRP